jgi:HAMP domain-containing protein
MSALTPEQIRVLADRADKGDAYEYTETTLVDEMATALRTAADEIDRLAGEVAQLELDAELAWEDMKYAPDSE